MEDVAGIAGGPVDGRNVDAVRGGIVAHAEDDGFDARRGFGDILDAGQCLDFLDQQFNTDAFPDPELGFQLRQQQIDEDDIRRAHRLGQHDGIDILARTLDDRDDVLVAPLRADIIDADTAHLPAPIEAIERLDDGLAGTRLGGRGDRIFKIAKDMIGGRLRRLDHHLLAAAGNGELRAAQALGLPLGHGTTPVKVNG